MNVETKARSSDFESCTEYLTCSVAGMATLLWWSPYGSSAWRRWGCLSHLFSPPKPLGLLFHQRYHFTILIKIQGNAGHARSLPYDAWSWRIYWGACRVWPFLISQQCQTPNVPTGRWRHLIWPHKFQCTLWGRNPDDVFFLPSKSNPLPSGQTRNYSSWYKERWRRNTTNNNDINTDLQ